MKILLIALILLASTVCYAQTEANFIEKTLYPAVGLLYSQTESGGMQMRCTVTAVASDAGVTTFVTASHCACSNGNTLDKTKFFVTSDDESAKKFLEAVPVACGKQMKGDDFAVFSVKTDDFTVVALGNDAKSHYGEPIVNVASPLGLGKQSFRGNISAPKMARPIYEASQHINWTDAMLIQLFGTNGGSSGSAIVCLEQRAICGFLVGTIGDTETVGIQVSRFKVWYEKVKSGKIKQNDQEDIDTLKELLKK